MVELEDILLFQEMEDDEIESLLEVSREEVYTAGDEIFAEGDQGDSLYIILDGEVEIKKNGQLLTVLEEGKFFGEMALLDNSPRSASVFAGSQCRLLVITKEAIENLYQQNVVSVCKLFISIFKEISQKLRVLNESYVNTKKSIGPNFDDF